MLWQQELEGVLNLLDLTIEGVAVGYVLGIITFALYMNLIRPYARKLLLKE